MIRTRLPLLLTLSLAIITSVLSLTNVVYPDLTTVKGNHKEAYSYFLCTRENADQDGKLTFDALRINIWRLRKLDKERDIIIMICEYTPNWQWLALQELGAIPVAITLIHTPMKVLNPKWADQATKFHVWELTQWDKILYLDVDIFFSDDFIDIWKEPQTQVMTEIPANFSANASATHLGYKITDLYPYLFAAGPDNWAKQTLVDNRLNGGLFMLKPSLIHHELHLKIANDVSYDFQEMEQAVLNFIYHKSGPIPWASFPQTYDWFPIRTWDRPEVNGNEMRDDIKGYHFKPWGTYRPPEYMPWINKFQKHYDDMIAEIGFVDLKLLEIIKNSPDHLGYASKQESILVQGLKHTRNNSTFFAIATTDLVNKPTHEQIQAQLDSNGTEVAGAKLLFGDKDGILVIKGLIPNTTYMVYFTERVVDFMFGDIESLEITTKPALPHLRSVKSSSNAITTNTGLIIGFLVLFNIVVIFTYKMVQRRRQTKKYVDLDTQSKSPALKEQSPSLRQVSEA